MTEVRIARQGRIARVTIDNPPINAASHGVRAGLLRAVAEVDADPSLHAVVLVCAGRTFVAGADIREFDQPPQPPLLPEVIARIAASRLPWVAAIHGSALGGGLELALGCHYRVAHSAARLGFPEVTLGLIPGAGGTVRLPRLAPLDTALAMLTGGKPLDARAALAAGLIDALADTRPLADFALAFAADAADKPLPHPLAARPTLSMPDAGFWRDASAAAAAKARGQTAPVEAVEALRDAHVLPPEAALAAERARFTRLRDGAQSRALRHVFFAERAASRAPEGVAGRPIARAGVIGGGAMGAGIAAALLIAGVPVSLIERDAAAAAAARERIAGLLRAGLRRGAVPPELIDALDDNLDAGDDDRALAAADLVIEAVFEDADAKAAVLASAEAAAPGAILATNTSYLSVTALASGLRDPSRLVGLHFFSPAHVMKLVEIVRTDHLAADVLAAAFGLARRLGKTAVLCADAEGFIGNRILGAYRRRCDRLLEEGASPDQIDAALRDFGMPMGLYQMQDMAGLDISWAMRKRQAALRAPGADYVAIGDRLCEMGRFGQKTGAGYYRYAGGGRKGAPDPVVAGVIAAEAAKKGIARRVVSAAEIEAAFLDAITTEGRALLAQGVAQRPGDIDVVMILGYGFPRWRGGPMYMAGIEIGPT